MTVKARGLAIALIVAGATAAAPGRARAHPEVSALGTNRYVTVAVLGDRIDVTDALFEGLLTGGDERRAFDADGDGRLSPAEVLAAQARLRADGPAVSASLDDRDLSAPFAGSPFEASIDLGDEPRADGAPVVVERRQSFAVTLAPGPHRLRLVVEREPPRLLETEVGVVMGPGLSLGEGSDPVRFSGPRASALERRAATFGFVVAPPRRHPRGARGLALGLAVAALVVVVGAAMRRRGRRSGR
jgi:hypothetical protein